MKKLAVLLLGCALTFSLAALGETKDADQKWLEAVQKMVEKGEKKVSTPKEARANLLKEWGKKNGYPSRSPKPKRAIASKSRRAWLRSDRRYTGRAEAAAPP